MIDAKSGEPVAEWLFLFLIHFYTSDLPGKYAVVVEGIGADGRAACGPLRFTVEK